MTWKRLDASLAFSAKHADIPAASKIVWMYLVPQTDCAGRFIADPRLIKARCAPLDADVSLDSIRAALLDFHRVNLASFYVVSGKLYLELHDHEEYNPTAGLKYQKPQFPDPIAEDRTVVTYDVLTTFASCTSVNVTSVTSTSTSTAPAKRPRRPRREIVWGPGGAEFWAAWPPHFRKADEAGCASIWRGIDPAEHPTIMARLASWKASEKWSERGGEFVPAPKVWLGQARWRAEAPPATMTPGRASVPDAKDLKAGWDAEEKAQAAREAAMTPEEKAARAAKIVDGARRMGVKLPSTGETSR